MAVGSLEANVSSSPEKLARKYDPLPRVTFLNQSKDFVVDFAFSASINLFIRLMQYPHMSTLR